MYLVTFCSHVLYITVDKCLHVCDVNLIFTTGATSASSSVMFVCGVKLQASFLIFRTSWPQIITQTDAGDKIMTRCTFDGNTRRLIKTS